MLTKCLIDVTVPGTFLDEENHPLLKAFISDLCKKNINGHFIDTVQGWGSLNQSWFEFETEVDTDFDWCRLTCFSDTEWFDAQTGWLNYFKTGQLLMIIDYIIEKDGERTFIPHH